MNSKRFKTCEDLNYVRENPTFIQDCPTTSRCSELNGSINDRVNCSTAADYELLRRKRRNSRTNSVESREISTLRKEANEPVERITIEEQSAATLRNNFSKLEEEGDDNSSVNNDPNAKVAESLNNSPLLVEIEERCKLSMWDLPPKILQKYESRGLTKMFPWQVECLSNYRVLVENKNLVYSAPTSAGKTLVAELLILKTILERQKKAIFILPFVSVVREKTHYFQDLLSSSGIRVDGFMGQISPAGGLANTQLAIATIEKANSLINRLIEEGGLSSLGAVVVDELHLIGDPGRGYIIEMLLTKLKYMTLREEHVNIQLIGMSATLPKLNVLAEWLDAEPFETDFRPIRLEERCKINTTIYNNSLMPVRDLVPSRELTNDTDNILQLCIETIADGHSTLIFCPAKNWCESLAQNIAEMFEKLGDDRTSLPGNMLREQLDSDAIMKASLRLKHCPVGLDKVLKKTVSFGVAFHHAGLTMDERGIIEDSFSTGSLRVLVATSTLSSGVNLPARRVIVRSPLFGGKPMDTLVYKQMIGRAGRMGKDSAGESILICKPDEKEAAKSLMSATLNPVMSCLNQSIPMTRALLEAVASEVAYTSADIDLYTRCTFAHFDQTVVLENLTKDAMTYLTDYEFVSYQELESKESRWVATSLGKACLASSVNPVDGLFIFEQLQRARKSLALDTDLHIIYLVTPLSYPTPVDWSVFFDLWKSPSESERRVGQLVGIEEWFLASALRGISKHGRTLNIHRKFYMALALHDLVQEVPLAVVADKYSYNRGVLQDLQQSASTFAGMVTQFCKQLGWLHLESLFSQFQERLHFGVSSELLDLLHLPALNGLRARSLFKEGITSIAELAIADERRVERALHKALPFESEKTQQGEQARDAAKRNQERTIFITAKHGLTPYEAAVMLIQEATTFLQHDLGVREVHSHFNASNVKHVARDSNLFKSFSDEVAAREEIAIALATDKFVDKATGIGNKLFGMVDEKKLKVNETCVYGDKIVNSIAICWGRNVVYYISFENRNDGEIPLEQRLELLRKVLANPALRVRCHQSKDTYKFLHQCCKISANCKFIDPKVAQWLIEPDSKEKSLCEMASIYLPQDASALPHSTPLGRTGNAWLSLNRDEAATYAFTTWYVMENVIKKLRAHSKLLWETFDDVETRVTSIIARSELSGIGINLESLQELSVIIPQEMAKLEKRADELTGRKFSFTSSKEIAQTLGIYKGGKVSTRKAVLETVKHPLSKLVMLWRKLKGTQEMMVFPLLNLAHHSSRIHGICVMNTVTGRISMQKPNLQTVPKDFHSEDETFVFSMRGAFVPNSDNVILSADYSQLELRILAHFSEDPVLCEIMRTDCDIFKMIAAQWHNVSEVDISDDIRQRTKQLCYGIIYGMGPQTLAKKLKVSEMEAKQFMKAFLNTYPNISKWMEQVTNKSREDGYVTTLMERRRMLPGLNSDVSREQSQAERQAVNTKIQGSAADVVKKAMVLIDDRLHVEFPNAPKVLSEIKSVNNGAHLVLHLHDELLYEVNKSDLDQVAKIVKQSMEESYRLRIPLPVKMKVGPTWGNLNEYNIPKAVS